MSAKKQKAKSIVSSFQGKESENKELLSKKKLLRYSPNMEYFINSSEEVLIAIVRGENPDQNPVYRITEFQLIGILEQFAHCTEGVVYFYKVPKSAFD